MPKITYRDEYGKTCPRCETHKPWSDYGPNRATRDGCQAYCRDCMKLYSREYEAAHAMARQARGAEKLAREADAEKTKICRKCGQEKPHLEFYAHRRTGDGRANYCRDCAKAYQRQRRDAAKTAEYNKLRQLDPVRRRKHEQNIKAWRLKLYGLTPEGYNALLEAQDGRCAICGEPGKVWANRNLHVDHDHESGTVRGLLCGRCNVGLGFFGDDIERLSRAITYLARPPAEKTRQDNGGGEVIAHG